MLKWYHDLFHAVLHAGDRSLLVVGYSFRDPHINATIVSAAKDAGLKLFVLAPSTPEDFKTRLSGVHSHSAADLIPGGEKIWQSLYAYYSGSITNYYMSNNAKLPAPGRALFDDLGLKSWPLS